MRNSRKFLLVAGMFSSLALAGCGEGFEVVQYEGFPYGNDRTAGSGVAYVRVNMMPEKGPVVDIKLEEEPEEITEPVETEPEPAEEYPEKAEKVFREMQKK